MDETLVIKGSAIARERESWADIARYHATRRRIFWYCSVGSLVPAVLWTHRVVPLHRLVGPGCMFGLSAFMGSAYFMLTMEMVYAEGRSDVLPSILLHLENKKDD